MRSTARVRFRRLECGRAVRRPSEPVAHRTPFSADNRIRDTLNNLILKSPQEWQTSAALPFTKIEGVVVEWDEMHFDVRLLQRVPYEGVSRMRAFCPP